MKVSIAPAPLRAGFTALAVAFLLSAAGASAQSTDAPARARSTEEMEIAQLPTQYVLAQRWGELIVGVLGEFWREGRDPTARIEADFSTRLIGIRTVRADREEWVSRRLTEQELASADLATVAKELYARSTGPSR